ncbi:MAG: hypothetical protein KFH98_11975 [Gemmatimonadetes bacterium]|nr:hypothetical protein [Gemmatimonadota bacterium]
MWNAPRGRVGLALVLATLSVSCGEGTGFTSGPTSEEEAVQYRMVKFSAATAPQVEAVRLDAHRQAQSATAYIDANGGQIQVGAVSINIPQGALSQGVDIRVTLPEHDYAVLELEPHGLVFAKAIQVSYNIAGTSAAGRPVSDLAGVYTAVPLEDGTAWAYEVTEPKLSGDVLTFYTTHFSTYLLALAGYILVGG